MLLAPAPSTARASRAAYFGRAALPAAARFRASQFGGDKLACRRRRSLRRAPPSSAIGKRREIGLLLLGCRVFGVPRRIWHTMTGVSCAPKSRRADDYISAFSPASTATLPQMRVKSTFYFLLLARR